MTYRTHTCGALRASDAGASVVLLGWVHRVRDLGGVMFLDLRDRHGITQIVLREENCASGTWPRIRPEFVLEVHGRLERRAPESINPKIDTGEVELIASEVQVLNEARTPPFPINEDAQVAEETRLRYRYLDLRRPELQHNLILRHKVALAARQYFDREGFLEIETPILTRSTPEGARDYLVPSRLHAGEFFALPQSPQIFKQILMIAGLDRYVQIVRCFRDEDLRADRQPEFTQIDVEVSFATEELIYGIVEGAVQAMWQAAGHEVSTPFPRLSYADAMLRYGSDKPDLRPGLEISDLAQALAGSPATFLFQDDAGQPHVVRGFVVPGGGRYSDTERKELVEVAGRLFGGRLAWARLRDDESVHTSAKPVGDEFVRRAVEAAGGRTGDLLLFMAGPEGVVVPTMGALRLHVAKKENLLDPKEYRFVWVTEFPLFAWNPDERRWDSMHHPFTSPRAEDVPLLESAPAQARARAYDLALNGSEIAGGSIRIHMPAVQRQVFRLLGIGDEDAKARFGFFLHALEFGTPPHGGIAFGLDRILALLCGESSIREVIAFPKTAQAVDLMAGAPSAVDAKQLRELRIKTVGDREARSSKPEA